MPGRLLAGCDLELGQDGADVMVDRLRRDAQARGDLLVAQVLGEQEENVRLPRCQTERVVPCCSTRTAGNAAGILGAELAPDQGGGRSRAQPGKDLERPQLCGAIAMGEGERLVVGTTELMPDVGGPLPVADDFQVVGQGHAIERWLVVKRPGTP